jgi:hypothetical protein
MMRDGAAQEEIAAHFGIALDTLRAGLARRKVPRRERPTVERARDLKLHDLWSATRAKCHRPSHKNFASYGAKGIRMCPEWRSSFNAFRAWALASGYRLGLRLVLKHRDSDFLPGNCEWVNPSEEIRRRPRRGSGGKKPNAVIDWELAQRLYMQDGLTPATIAARFGARPSSIHAGLRARGVTRERQVGSYSTLAERRLKKTWRDVHGRCSRSTHRAYRYYGARGVRVGREWGAFEPFLEWSLSSGWKPGLCLVRRDRRRPYGPRNCEWVTRREVKRRVPINHAPRPPRRPVTAFGETKGLYSWGDDPRCPVTSATISKRLLRGMDPERAITDPPSRPAAKKWIVRAFGERKSVGAWVRDPRCKIGRTGLCYRLRSGMPAEEAITLPPRSSPGRLARREITAMGSTKSVSEWSRDRRCMVGMDSLCYRLLLGWSPEDAIRTPPFEEPLSERLARRAGQRARRARKA